MAKIIATVVKKTDTRADKSSYQAVLFIAAHYTYRLRPQYKSMLTFLVALYNLCV